MSLEKENSTAGRSCGWGFFLQLEPSELMDASAELRINL